MTEQPVDRVMMGGSGPGGRQKLVYMMQMSLCEVIRQKIEVLPEPISKEDVLKVLDECKPWPTERGLGNRPSSE